jgi:beta-fructofuranosidase
MTPTHQNSIQYFKPQDPLLFVGDCMPFSHAGIFYFYYLQDENHHQALGGLGGHQWGLATSPDLRAWQHHPLALPITAEWEGSICTGSVLRHAGKFYAFYATRYRDYTQHLGLAVSTDGIHYEKQHPNPLFSPPAGYNPYHFRDPFAFHGPDGKIHLIVTALKEGGPIPERGGCLAHLVSSDPFQGWELGAPFFVPGTPDVPECADTFEWNGWYYLIFSSRLQAHYRMSRSPFGPWQRPPLDTFEPAAARVMKTAAWGQRRIGVAWVGTRAGGSDAAEMQWGGQAVFRELLQLPNGALRIRPLPEVQPAVKPETGLEVKPVTPAPRRVPAGWLLQRSGGLEALWAEDLPRDAHLRLRLRLGQGQGPFGLRLRAGGFESGYSLDINPAEASARLADQELRGWQPMGETVEIEITLYGTLLDVCLDGQHCLVTRGVEQNGNGLWIYAIDRELTVEEARVAPLEAPGIE